MAANKISKTLVAAACAMLLSACGGGSGNTDKQPKPGKGIVSLAPSNTELLYAIGAQSDLQAVSTQCDYPKEAQSLPKAGTFERADLEKLASIRPRAVFLVNGQEGIAAALKHQKAFDTRVHLLNNDSIGSISKNVLKLGIATDHIEKAEQLANEFDAGVESIKKSTAALKRPKVFFCVWPEPLVTVGKNSYLNDGITICGGKNIAAGLEAPYPTFSVEKLLLDQPDVIILPAQTEKTILKRSPWTSLAAVKNNRVYYLPDKDSDRLSRPTLRTLEGLKWLVERIHPQLSTAGSINKNSKSH